MERVGFSIQGYKNKLSIEKNSELELVERAKSDPVALGELYDLYYSKILNYIYISIQDIDAAEEVTSNTFFKVLNSLPKYKHRSSFRAWIFKIATNEIKMFWRSKKNREIREKAYQFENDLEQIYFISPKVEVDEGHEEKMHMFRRLHKSLNSLPEKYRFVLILRYFEGLRYDEISKVVGKRIGTVKSLIHRGLKRLRILYDNQNATFSL